MQERSGSGTSEGPLELSASDTPQKIQPPPSSHLRPSASALPYASDDLRRQLTRIEAKLDEVLARLNPPATR